MADEFKQMYDAFISNPEGWIKRHGARELKLIYKTQKDGCPSDKRKADWIKNKLELHARVRNWACQ